MLMPIPDHDSYFVDEQGNVCKRINVNHPERRQWRAIKPELKPCGYLYVKVSREATYTRFRVHRLVAMVYVPNPENKPVVHHKDGNKLNNHYTNLEWVTFSENTKHAFDAGLAVNAKGVEDSQSKPIKMTDISTGESQVFASAGDAHRATGVNRHTLMGRARNRHRGRDGLCFEYLG